MKVDNENNNVATPTVIMENQTVFYEFDEMQVEGRICWSVIKTFELFGENEGHNFRNSNGSRMLVAKATSSSYK